MPGYGWLSYSEDLVLTRDGQPNRSIWKLSKYFQPSFNTKMIFHEKLISPI